MYGTLVVGCDSDNKENTALSSYTAPSRYVTRIITCVIQFHKQMTRYILHMFLGPGFIIL